MDIKGKKLLILGANPATVPLVITAKNLGVRTYVADYIPGNTAKKYADVPVDIDATDIDALAEFVKKEGIEGITIGTAEVLLPYYAELCERVGLPAYGTKEQLEIMSNKVLFKKACRKFGAQVAPEFDINDDNLETEGRNLPFPVIVKPEDGNSTKGITICYNFNQLKGAVEYAKESCLSKKYFIEKYFDTEKNAEARNFYYVVVNGEAKLLFMFDNLGIRTEDEDEYLNGEGTEGKIKPGGLAVAPSKYTKLFMEKMDKSIQNLVTGMGIKNGPIFFQSFLEDGEFYLYECGYRLAGAIDYWLTKAVYNVSTAEMLVNFALTGDMANNCDISAIDPYLGETAAQLCLYGRDGKIVSIEGVEKVRKNVPELIDIHYARKVGDTLENTFGTYQQILFVIFVRFPSLNRLKECIDYIYNTIKVIDENGNNIALKTIDGKSCAKYFNENRFYPMDYND